jgi:K(+)-stimulated pyrophosphate-energized sodium pump
MSGLSLAQSGEGVSLSGGNVGFVLAVAVIGVIALVVAAVLRKEVLAADAGTEGMQRIALAVQEGASAYLTRQFKTLAVFAALAFGLLFILPGDASIRVGRSIFFVLGAGFSACIGYLGMWLAVRANVRVAAAARQGNRDAAMQVAFRTGGVVGMSTVGLGLLGAAAVVMIYRGDAPSVLEGFGSALPCSRCSCVSAAASSPRPPTWAPTWSARWSRTSPRTTPATPRPLPTTSATTWATAPAWRPTCSSPTPSCSSPP